MTYTGLVEHARHYVATLAPLLATHGDLGRCMAGMADGEADGALSAVLTTVADTHLYAGRRGAGRAR